MRQINMRTTDFAEIRKHYEVHLFIEAKKGVVQAQSDLLILYANDDLMSEEIDKELHNTCREIARQSVNLANIADRAPLQVVPATYFSAEVKQLKRKAGRRKTDPKIASKIIEFRIRNKFWLEEEELKHVLTTDFSKNTKRRIDAGASIVLPKDRVKLIAGVEAAMVNYVQRLIKGAGKEIGRRYVRESFPRYDWSDLGARFPYPDDW